jgi:chromosomal replication initiator protein
LEDAPRGSGLALLENPEALSAWRQIRAELRRSLGDSTFEIWIEPLEPRALQGGMLLLEGPTATKAWVAKRFGPVLERCARAVLGDGATVALEGLSADLPAAGSSPGASPVTTLNPRYSFDQFIIGDGNRLAHAAALAVAELPGQAYSPLFLHAPPGLGKTHLLHAIGNYLTSFGGANVRYTTVEAFTNHFIRALGGRSLADFKRTYRDVDVLLIDDVQFLASKAKTEEEFFHTFNALYESGRQLVLTCDRIPSALQGLEERLRERFEAGLVADIKPPDLATRTAILRKRAQVDDIPLADDTVLTTIASRVTDNVRTLEGALIRVVAYHSLTGRPIDAELAATVLDTMYPRSPSQQLTLAMIQSAVAARFRMSVAELVSANRAARVAWARQLAIYLARELTASSLHEIGEAFGGRNHATILHACRRVSERTNEDNQAAHELQELTAELATQRDDRGC